MDKPQFIAFLEAFLEAVREDDSMEGRIAYRWGATRGTYVVDAVVRVGNSEGQGGVIMHQDSPPPPPPEPLARIFPQAGRLHLAVAGVVVATQGDPCRDEALVETHGRIWDLPALEDLEARINHPQA